MRLVGTPLPIGGGVPASNCVRRGLDHAQVNRQDWNHSRVRSHRWPAAPDEGRFGQDKQDLQDGRRPSADRQAPWPEVLPTCRAGALARHVSRVGRGNAASRGRRILFILLILVRQASLAVLVN